MPFNNKNLFITLLSLCTFQTYAAQCTAEIFAKNKLNNFILLTQQSRTDFGECPHQLHCRLTVLPAKDNPH